MRFNFSTASVGGLSTCIVSSESFLSTCIESNSCSSDKINVDFLLAGGSSFTLEALETSTMETSLVVSDILMEETETGVILTNNTACRSAQEEQLLPVGGGEVVTWKVGALSARKGVVSGDLFIFFFFC